ncbi:hypothetical protein EYC80_006041 [Monilinia laxa]|uniref:Uncharacterized protein n=1 Tax=Monilinia laxa TaxID=61186 RepID=A0A5N6KG97_MONLA|nr:hypothetical protein EYC80_006041 [Monilinia laxa]
MNFEACTLYTCTNLGIRNGFTHEVVSKCAIIKTNTIEPLRGDSPPGTGDSLFVITLLNTYSTARIQISKAEAQSCVFQGRFEMHPNTQERSVLMCGD